jgi:hypothetical protein
MAETPGVVFHESPSLSLPVDRSRRYTRILLILFLCTLPLVNPIVHGDGVGYYAYVRAPLIQHNLRFEEDWRHLEVHAWASGSDPSMQFTLEARAEQWTKWIPNGGVRERPSATKRRAMSLG